MADTFVKKLTQTMIQKTFAPEYQLEGCEVKEILKTLTYGVPSVAKTNYSNILEITYKEGTKFVKTLETHLEKRLLAIVEIGGYRWT